MSKTKTTEMLDQELKAYFLQRATEFQRASRCDCPAKSKVNSAMARKFLFYVIDHQHQSV